MGAVSTLVRKDSVSAGREREKKAYEDYKKEAPEYLKHNFFFNPLFNTENILKDATYKRIEHLKNLGIEYESD